jgi:Uma2 family endonuclease
MKMQATLDDLYRVDGKAELIDGEIVHLMPTGRMPGYAADEIYLSLRLYVRANHLPGIVVADNKGFAVHLPHRGSFSPDTGYYEGPNSGMRFYEGAPLFAVEVRSENDYGPVAEQEMADKRRDYFATGTEVVWDVDLLSDDVVRVYRADNPETPTRYRRGEIANAEPAVPGWTMPVDDLFEP